MSEFADLYMQFLSAYEDATVKIPCCGLKFVKDGEADLDTIFSTSPTWMETFPRSLASCGFSYKASKGGWTLKVTAKNIGCPAGAMSLGLIRPDATNSFAGGCYVKSMAQPATPADFTSGFVYAPQQSGHPEFSLFGHEDCGRYETLEAARRAIAAMPVIPDPMRVVYYYHPTLSCVNVPPDLVHFYCTPLQAMRMIQGYAYRTGERFEMSCIGIRGVSCDMTAWPYVTGRMNGTFLCLGARGISGWEEEYVGFGMPFAVFRQIVDGMERSKRGFPYQIFPKMTDEIWPDGAAQ